jgi:uncharacterized protein (DUF58 family)
MDRGSTPAYRHILLAACPLAGFLGLALGLPALKAFAAAGSLLLLFAYALPRRRLRALAIRRELYPSAFEGEGVAVSLVLENQGGRTVHLVEIADSFGPGLAHRQLLLEPGPLHGRCSRRLTYRTFCSRSWGIYPVGPLSLRTADPMGLFPARRSILQVEPFAVYPQAYRVAALERLGGRATATPQPTTRDRPGQSLAYLGVRDYRPGDDLRRVHWPATAHRGHPVVKLQEVDLVPYVSLFLDLERAHRAGTGRKSTLDYLVRSAASLLASALREGDTVQVFAEGRTPLLLPPGQGDVHLAYGLWELIRARQEGTASLFELVLRHRPALPEGSTAVLLLGTISFSDDDLDEVLEALAARRIQAFVLLVNNHSFIPIDRRTMPREQAGERTRDLLALLRHRGVTGTVLSAEEDLEEALGRADSLGMPA